MKTSTKIIAIVALFYSFSMPNSIALADDFDLMDLVLGGIIGATREPDQKYYIVDCKPGKTLVHPIQCGNKDGPNSFVENFYVFIVDESLIGHELNPTVGINNLPLTTDHCQADKLEVTRASLSDPGLPDHIKPGNLVVPKGKKAIYWKIRVYNGFGEMDLKMKPTCLEPR